MSITPTEAIKTLREALGTCSVGGYRDIDGDFVKRLWFAEDVVKAALSATTPDKIEDDPRIKELEAKCADWECIFNGRLEYIQNLEAERDKAKQVMQEVVEISNQLGAERDKAQQDARRNMDYADELEQARKEATEKCTWLEGQRYRLMEQIGEDTEEIHKLRADLDNLDLSYKAARCAIDELTIERDQLRALLAQHPSREVLASLYAIDNHRPAFIGLTHHEICAEQEGKG